MELSQQRKGEIAWIYLLYYAKSLKVDDLSPTKFLDRFKTWLASSHPDHKERLHDSINRLFCLDLIDAIMDMIPEKSTEVDFRLDEENRLELAYLFCLHLIREEGIRVGKNTKRDINTRAAELGIETEEAQAFIKIVVNDILKVNFA